MNSHSLSVYSFGERSGRAPFSWPRICDRKCVFLLLKTGILGGMDVNGCLSAVTILSICEHLQGCIGKH